MESEHFLPPQTQLQPIIEDLPLLLLARKFQQEQDALVEQQDPQSSSSSSSSPTPQRSHTRKKPATLTRCKTAPAMAVMRDLKRKTAQVPNPFPESDSNIRQALLYLLMYLCLGVAIYSFNQEKFSGTETHPVVDALYFCIVTMCTIGYGDIAPVTPLAKLFSCVFVLVGFGFIDILLSGVVNYVLDLQENMILGVKMSHYSHDTGNNNKPQRGFWDYIVDVAKGRMRIRIKVGLALGVVVLCIGVGALVLFFVEGLDCVDSIYLSVMSVTTVGYGDKAFKTLPGRLFAAVWLLVSTLAVARAFLYLAEARIDRRNRRTAKLVLQKEITPYDLVAAAMNDHAFINKSEYIVYKLKEMGKIGQKDITLICDQFSKLDSNHSGKITLPDLMENCL